MNYCDLLRPPCSTQLAILGSQLDAVGLLGYLLSSQTESISDDVFPIISAGAKPFPH